MRTVVQLILLLFTSLTFAQAQKAVRFYRTADRVVIADSAGPIRIEYPAVDVNLTPDGAYVRINVKGSPSNYYSKYPPNKFLNLNNTPYSILSATAAIEAYNASIVNSSAPGSSTSITTAPATFGASAPTSNDYTSNQTITTTNVLKILIENVGTTGASFTYAGYSYNFVQGDQRVFDAVFDATSNKLIPIASLVINPSASAPIRVTRFLKQ